MMCSCVVSVESDFQTCSRLGQPTDGETSLSPEKGKNSREEYIVRARTARRSKGEWEKGTRHKEANLLDQ
jgi:hypothetical protein